MALSPKQLTIAIVVVLSAAIGARVVLEPKVGKHALASTSVEIPAPRTIDEGPEGSFLLRPVPLFPCDKREKEEPPDNPTGDPCTRLIAVDIDSGARASVPALVVDDVAGASASVWRARALAGEVVVVGSFLGQSRLDELEGKPYALDAGRGRRPMNDLALKVRDIAPLPPRERLERLPRDLVAFGCSWERFDENALVLDATHVYAWACRTIVRLDKTGASPPDRIASVFSGVLAMNDFDVFWIEDQHVRRRAKAGGESQVIGSELPGSPHICNGKGEALAADAVSIYCCDSGGAPNESSGRPPCALTRHFLRGDRSPVKLATFENLENVMLDGETVYFTTAVYSRDASKGHAYAIMSTTKSGGEPRTVLRRSSSNELNAPHSLTVIGDELFWTNLSSTAAIVSMEKTGRGSLVAHSAAENTYPSSLVVLGDDLYWTTRNSRLFHVARRSKDQIFPGDTERDRLGPRVAADARSIYMLAPLAFAKGMMVTLVARPRPQ